MRTKFLTLAALLVAGAVRAEVVIDGNSGGTTASTAGASFQITFTNTTSNIALTTLQLFSASSGSDSISLSLVNGGTTVTTTASSTNGIFNFVDWLAISSGTSTLTVSDLDVARYYQTNPGSNNITADGTTYGFSSPSSTPITTGQFLNYQLSAVPEPGTMLLGGIAAAVGGAGAWWKRRKQRLAAAEAAATPV